MSSPFSLPLLLLSVWLEGGWAVTLQQLQSITVQGLGAVAYLALLSTLLGYRPVDQTAAALPHQFGGTFVVAGAGGGFALGHAVAGEFPTLLQWLGTAGCCWAWWSTSLVGAGTGPRAQEESSLIGRF